MSTNQRITSRFGATSTARDVAAGHDLTGRTAIVTGGASGIGVETARALAERGAAVTLAVRNLDAGAAVAAEIDKTATGPKTEVRRIDLASQASVRGFVDDWGGQPVDILINNAGVMACPHSYTDDDLEMQIGANHFGHYTLSTLMASAMEKAAKAGRAARLVALSSIGHRRSGINWDDPHYRTRPYDKWEAYGQSKTANSLFAVGFNRRFADRGITANAVMPGGIMTPLQRHLPREEMIAFGWMDESGKINDRFKSTEQGAATSVWAALAAELEGVGGLYLEDCAEAAPWTADDPVHGVMPHALEGEAAERLWELTAKTTGVDR